MANDNKAPAFRELSFAKIARLKPEEWVIVWPIASIEQHGPHLPVGTDAIIP